MLKITTPKKILAFFVAILSISAVSLFQAAPAQASHLRGSIVTVEYHAPTTAHSTAEVHVVATTLAAKSLAAYMTSVRVFQVTGTGASSTVALTNCTGNNTRLPAPDTYVDNSNPLFDIAVDAFTITGCFNNPGDYVFSATTSARIGGVVNTTNSTIQFESMVHIDGVNDAAAPTYNAGYMYNIAYESNLNYSTNLGGLGAGNTPVTYSLVTSSASALGGYGATQVPCSDLNTTTGAYRINSSFCTGADTITSAFGGGAKYYALKVKATDSTGQYTTRDVLLYFNTTSNQAPAFTTVPANGAFTVTPGTTSTAQFCAQDPDVADTLNFTFSPTRSWITQGAVTAVSPATTPNTYCVDFTFAPPVGTTEAFNFEVSVYDNSNTFVRSASNLYSFQAGAVLPGNSSGPVFTYNPSSYSVETGKPLTIGAPTSTGSTVVTFSISPALPAGLTLNATTGEITGTSTDIGSASYTVDGTDAQSATGTTHITITITAAVEREPVGPMVYTITPRIIYFGNDQEVTITGIRLADAVNLVVRGIALDIKANTPSTLTFVMPKQTTEGEAALSFRTPQGNITWENALLFRASAPVTDFQAANSEPRRFAAIGFDAGSSYLNATVTKQLKSIAKKIGTTSVVTCNGVTMGPTVLARDAKLSKARAVAACGQLKTLLPKGVTYVTKSSQELELGSHVRRVEIEVTD
ncbi:MAG: putative Ig domain-containing protein [Rhodoluna sp.]|nr:putative Ig domain-containing protein [Rhodoluna sp.]